MSNTVAKEKLEKNNKISIFKSIRFKLIVMSIFVIIIILSMIFLFNNFSSQNL